jgi:hypothetical protein
MAGKSLAAAAATFAFAAAAALSVSPASAASAPFSDPRVLVHYDLNAGEQPENVLVEPDGHLVVALSAAREIVNVDSRGHERHIATLPRPADGGSSAPVLGFPLVGGLARTPDGTLYVNYTAGDAALTGIWRLRPGSKPRRIAAMPAGSFLNGLDLDRRTGYLYSSDSALGVIWRVPVGGGRPVQWATGTPLKPTGLLGANGLKVHNGAVWTDNSDSGSLLRIAIGSHGAPGPIETRATGKGFLDDFIFPGSDDTVIIGADVENEVLIIAPDGSSRPVLTAADGLEGPTSVAIDRGHLYVLSGAFVSAKDPNIVVARIDRG